MSYLTNNSVLEANPNSMNDFSIDDEVVSTDSTAILNTISISEVESSSFKPDSRKSCCVDEKKDSNCEDVCSCKEPLKINMKNVVKKSRGPLSYAAIRITDAPETIKLFDMETGFPNKDKLISSMNDPSFAERLRSKILEPAFGTIAQIDSGANVCVIHEDLARSLGLTLHKLPSPMVIKFASSSASIRAAVHCVFIGINVCGKSFIFQALVAAHVSPLMLASYEC